MIEPIQNKPAGLDTPSERHRTDEQRRDIQRAWDIVGIVTDGHLLNSTEGHLAVLRGIQIGRLLSVDDAQPHNVPSAGRGSICCYCDTPLACEKCGHEQPNDSQPPIPTIPTSE